ncbi:MAG: DAK2 domain-containing protein, partial [Dehalococcoidia bacterium]|nr:DAK2 domain-containing protein [Dehalococcoidia bacterium]
MSGETLSGTELRAAITSASDYLTASAKAVDAINVYPVPDGDTGSNMAATLREACDHMLALEEPLAAGQVLATFARGALYGGRGNSGVILSQSLLGLAKGGGEVEDLGGEVLA